MGMNHQELVDAIFEVVLKETGLDKNFLITSKDRTTESVYARAIFVGIARKKFFSYAKIGRILNKDHTSVMHTVRTRVKEIDIDSIIKRNEKILEKGKKQESKERYVNIKLSGKYGYLHKMFGAKCFVCDFDEVVEVHHITPKHRGGTDDLENLALLCPNHHALADRGMLAVKNKFIVNLNDSPPPLEELV